MAECLLLPFLKQIERCDTKVHTNYFLKVEFLHEFPFIELMGRIPKQLHHIKSHIFYFFLSHSCCIFVRMGHY